MQSIDMVLHCPECGVQHVDAPEPDKGWENPPHRSHLCHKCETVWRPADVPTNGVAVVATRGERDTWPKQMPAGGTEFSQLVAMLTRADIGHGIRHDHNPPGESVQVESAESDRNGDWWVTEFGFDAKGKLKDVATYPGQEG